MSIKWCERPEEGPVQSQVDFMWRCPEKGGDPTGWADPSFVHCKCDPSRCHTNAAILANHFLSQKNINFPSRPATTPTEPVIDGFPPVKNIKR